MLREDIKFFLVLCFAGLEHIFRVITRQKYRDPFIGPHSG